MFTLSNNFFRFRFLKLEILLFQNLIDLLLLVDSSIQNIFVFIKNCFHFFYLTIILVFERLFSIFKLVLKFFKEILYLFAFLVSNIINIFSKFFSFFLQQLICFQLVLASKSWCFQGLFNLKHCNFIRSYEVMVRVFKYAIRT